MTSEWDGTAWEGRATVAPQKAATGPGVGFFATALPMSSKDRTPQAFMRSAQLAYHVNPWIGTAESVVTRKVVGLPWHLENADDEEYSDNAGDGVPSPPDVRAARLLIERPQFLLPANGRKPATGTRRLMWSITSRHLGLCGMAYWFADGLDQRGIPTAWLYVNPARMWPAEDDNGNLTGWVLDAKDQSGRGGTPLELGEVLPFYLDPPDFGNLGTGIYERAVLKAQITNAADQHSAYVLGTGGRIAGIVSPKDGTIPDEAFKALVNEFRNVNEAPDAAKRTTIMQGPTDFIPTAADPSRLDLVQLTKMNRDDIFTIWGVPPSQGPVPTATGLNSGETKGYDEAILLQGAVHDRVVAIRETLQFGWLDKYAPQTVIDLEIEEPEFDDDTPAYDRLSKANGVALTNAERREIIGLPPTGDKAIDDAILLPAMVTTWATVGQPMPEPTPPPVAPAFVPSATPVTAELPVPPGKAQSDFLGLRRSVDQRTIPAIKRSVSDALAAQKRDVIAWIRGHAAHLASKPKDTAWWNDDRENKRMEAALRPHVAGVTATVTARTREVLDRPAKADPFEDRVAAFVWSRTGERIRANINPTTKQLIIDAVTEGFSDGLSPGEIADILETSSVFDAVRAELIARTETMLAYNDSALQGFTEFGVDTVEPLDGDQDEECIARLKRGPVSIDVALDDIDHPNGTLDWVPYFGKAVAHTPPEPPSAIPLSATAAPDLSELMAVLANRPEPVMVQVTSSTVTRTVLDRDLDTGRVIGFHEEPVSAA